MAVRPVTLVGARFEALSQLKRPCGFSHLWTFIGQCCTVTWMVKLCASNTLMVSAKHPFLISRLWSRFCVRLGIPSMCRCLLSGFFLSLVWIPVERLLWRILLTILGPSRMSRHVILRTCMTAWQSAAACCIFRVRLDLGLKKRPSSKPLNRSCRPRAFLTLRCAAEPKQPSNSLAQRPCSKPCRTKMFGRR